jgi:peptide/nickel transport system ATP-binding protein
VTTLRYDHPLTERQPEERPVVLEVHDFSVDYGQDGEAVPAVRSVDLTLHRGEVLGLAGESGSGKSTLAYGVTRLLRPPGVIRGGDVTFHDARPAERGGLGSVAVLDASPEELHRLRWSEIAIVFQSAMHALNPVINIEVQLTDTLAAHRPELNRRARRARATELLAMVGISSDRLRSYPHELSGGMRQRVMIAMALALEPQIVILDEPTTALDVVTQREILTEIEGLREELGFAVLFITHDLSLLGELADTIAIMYAGRIVEQAPAADLFRDPFHPYTAGLINSFPLLHGERERLSGIPGFPPDLRALPSGCAFRPRCPRAIARCASDDPVLLPMPAAAGAAAGRTVACWRPVADPDDSSDPANPSDRTGPSDPSDGEVRHG